MKKLFFVWGNLGVGGISKSLVSLLRVLDGQGYEIDLFLYSHSGVFMNELPESVRLVNKSKFIYEVIGRTKDEIKQSKNPLKLICRLVFVLFCKIFGSQAFFDILLNFTPKFSGYDYAVSYSHDVDRKSLYAGYNQLVLKNVSAKRKITWVHCESGALAEICDDVETGYQAFDRIVTISQTCKQTFCDMFPALSDKVHVIFNFISEDYIRGLSCRGDMPKPRDAAVKLVTCARMDKNKAVDRGVEAVVRLLSEGYDLSYTVIGDGPEYRSIKAIAERGGAGDRIRFDRTQGNPYCTVKASDLLIVPSITDAYPTVAEESMMLGTPVLGVEYAAAHEQLDGCGIVAENSTQGIYDALKTVLDNSEMLPGLKAGLAERAGNNQKSLANLGELFE